MKVEWTLQAVNVNREAARPVDRMPGTQRNQVQIVAATCAFCWFLRWVFAFVVRVRFVVSTELQLVRSPRRNADAVCRAGSGDEQLRRYGLPKFTSIK